MRREHLAPALVLVLVGVLPLGGCATTRPGTIAEVDPPSAEYRYSTGRGSQDFALPPLAVKAAVYEALEDLKMTVAHRGRDGVVSQIDGRTVDDRSITITIRPHRGGTHVGCRIGWFGDDPLSKALLERVGIRLGTLPPEAIPEKPPSSPASNPFFSRDAVPDSVMLREYPDAPYRDRPDL
ncbi:MAG: DUF3568 family protein [Isosphaeraceae bacterium]